MVCDHHLPGAALPEAYAVLNPQRSDCPFLGKELCGAGVALMLIRSICQVLDRPNAWNEYLGLCAIATCCDIVPLQGINRVIVKEGLAQLSTTRSAGLSALLAAAGHTGALNVESVVFKIGPRINAAGRMAQATLAVALLLEDDLDRAAELASQIENLNKSRKTQDKAVTLQAAEQMELIDPDASRSATVVQSADWHKGIIGIVASRLTEQRYRPTVVLTNIEGMLTGSARSVAGVHIYNALARCRDHLEKFGGHAAAAGLTLKEENYTAFANAFEAAVAEETAGQPPVQKLDIDLELDFSDWYADGKSKFLRQLYRLRPFWAL